MDRRLRLGALAAIAAAIAALGIVAHAATARADACTTEDTLFTGERYTSINDWATHYGSTNRIQLVDRNLNANCASENGSVADEAGSTAHVRLGGQTLDWVEVGWGEYFTSKTDTTHQWRALTEWGINNNAQASQKWSFPCTIGLNNYAYWRVGDNPLGSNTFHLSLSCNGGSTYSDIANYTTNNDFGIAMGEEFRRGGNTAGMMDTQNDLQHKLSDGTWQLWTDNKCYANFQLGANWDTVKDTVSKFHTVLDNTPSC